MEPQAERQNLKRPTAHRIDTSMKWTGSMENSFFKLQEIAYANIKIRLIWIYAYFKWKWNATNDKVMYSQIQFLYLF